MADDVLILIPARMASTRLPGKPLADIAGQPMIVHVLRCAEAAKIGAVAVATDSEAVFAAVEKAGGRAVMTRADHVSGSDRIFEALQQIDPDARARIVVNVQGDLPTLEPGDLKAALKPLADPAVDIATLAAEIKKPEERDNPNVVKLVGSPVAPGRLRATSFSRAATGSAPHYHHIGLYAYRRAALERFIKLPPSANEQREKLEQLRAMDAGMRIDAMIVGSVPLGVDTPDDLETARTLLRGRRLDSGVKRNRAMAKMKIAFQGELGANSHLAIREAHPDAEAMPCATFEDAFAAIASGEAALAMIPVENSVAGRVADIHHLMPLSNVHIVAEHFMPVRHQLLAPKGAAIKDIKTVESHVHALGQCRKVIRKLGIKPVVAADTAGSAREIAEAGDKSRAAIASRLAAEIYGLDILQEDIEDESHNTTRFIVLSKEKKWAPRGKSKVVTTFVFRVKNVPAALYKALGGFATNGINMTKLESYMIEGNFFATQFYADVEGHPDDRGLVFALEELSFFCKELKILGVYPAHEFREAFEEEKA